MFNLSNIEGHIVLDCDEVLTRISPKWVLLMHNKENFEELNKYFLLSEKFDLAKDYDRILQRPEYFLDKWLKRKNIKVNNAFRKAKKQLYDLYNGDFYKDLPPTELALAISSLINSHLVTGVTIISRTIEGRPELDNSKLKFINRIFSGNMDKIDIVILDQKDETKADVIKTIEEKISIIAEDDLDNIRDIIENCDNLEDTTIMIPSYGYNRGLEDKYFIMAESKGATIKYYTDR